MARSRSSTKRTRGDSSVGCHGFTLVEILVAVAILAVLSLFLVGMSDQASRLWIRGESDDQYRDKARAILDFMGNEIKLAVVPISQNNSTSASSDPAPSLQFLVSPSNTTVPGLSPTYTNRDTIFFQAPLATDRSKGDLAEIGYLVEWTGTNPNLCRMLVNPSSADYLIYLSPANWLTTTAITDSIQPGNHYAGVFLTNVLGLFVQAYDATGNALASPFDSRANNNGHPLPATVEIAIVVVDDSHMKRMSSQYANTIQSMYSSSSYAAANFTGSSVAAQEATAFAGNLPAPIASGAAAASIKVSLNNYR